MALLRPTLPPFSFRKVPNTQALQQPPLPMSVRCKLRTQSRTFHFHHSRILSERRLPRTGQPGGRTHLQKSFDARYECTEHSASVSLSCSALCHPAIDGIKNEDVGLIS